MERVWKQVQRLLWRLIGGGILFSLCVGVFAWYVYQVPYTQPGIVKIDTYVEIPAGSAAGTVGAILQESGVIRSADAFVVTLRTLGKTTEIKSGTYYFNQPQNLQAVIERVTSSHYGLPTTTITLFEGEANYQYAQRLSRELEHVSETEFNRLAKQHEGYLFPDTYNFPLQADSREVIETMLRNYERRVGEVRDNYSGPHSWQDVMAMASIIETEANGSYEIKQRVSGVLWRRIEIGMPLQADAVFSYIYQQHLPRVLYRHLEVDSPYNVYKNNGLPPGPISNPGLDSIRAATDPANPGNHLFYITGNDGAFYYAKTLAGHNANIRNHLR